MHQCFVDILMEAQYFRQAIWATISIGHAIISIAQCPRDLVCWLLMPCWEGERTRGTKRRFAFINMITRSGGTMYTVAAFLLHTIQLVLNTR